jgi:hypothetical protein
VLDQTTGTDATNNNIVLDTFTASGDTKRPTGIGASG